MVQLKGLFKLAPSLAIKYFKNKNNKFSWDWYELWQDAHKKSFTVAKVMREDILKDIRSALDKALSEGKTFKEFSKELKPTLQKKGWWGEQIVVDSKGNAEKVQLGSMYRLKTIYSREMFFQFMNGTFITDIQKAVQFYFIITRSFGGKGGTFGTVKKSTGGACKSQANVMDKIDQYHEFVLIFLLY